MAPGIYAERYYRESSKYISKIITAFNTNNDDDENKKIGNISEGMSIKVMNKSRFDRKFK